MYVDYVRIYQKEGEESITCDPRKAPWVDSVRRIC